MTLLVYLATHSLQTWLLEMPDIPDGLHFLVVDRAGRNNLDCRHTSFAVSTEAFSAIRLRLHDAREVIDDPQLRDLQNRPCRVRVSQDRS